MDYSNYNSKKKIFRNNIRSISSGSFSAVLLVKRLMSFAFCLLLSSNFFFFYYNSNIKGRKKSGEKIAAHQSESSLLQGVEDQNDESTKLRKNPPRFTFLRAEEDAILLASNITSEISEPPMESSPVCEFTRISSTFEYLGRDGFEVISQKVKVLNLDGKELFLAANTSSLHNHHSKARLPRILCIVHSTSSSDQAQSLNAIKQTWGPKCDGFIIASEGDNRNNRSDEAILHIPAANNEWDKLVLIWKYVYEKFVNSYDFFFLSNADTYLIVENLRFFLASAEVRNAGGGPKWPQPLYLGRGSGGGKQQISIAAGPAGYVLNRSSLQRLVERGFQSAACRPIVFRQKKSHDEAIGQCLNRLSIFLSDTRDFYLAHRFNIFSPQYHASEKIEDDTNPTMADPVNKNNNMQLCGGAQKPPCPLRWGVISDQSISFGHIQPNLMKQLHALLYNMCIPSDLLQLASKVISFHKSSGKNSARPVIVDFLALSNHPFVGALDEHGNSGFRHNEKALRLNPPNFTWDNILSHDEKGKPICHVNWNPETSDYDINTFQRSELGSDGFALLSKQVRIGYPQQISSGESEAHSAAQGVKIFCAVYTISSNHFRIDPIRQTWGPKCDGFMVASNVTIPSLNAVHIPHWGEENYNGVWQKLRSIWSYVYSTYVDEYDFFYLGGDDFYLIVENLRLYVTSEEILSSGGGEGWPKPLYLGRRVLDRHDLNHVLNHGGPGYVLNKAALKLLVEKAFMQESCEPYRWKHSEDRFLGQCFRGVSVEPYDTRDQNFLHRFHVFTPYQIATGTWGGLGLWVKKYVCFDENEDKCHHGWDSVSKESISFHYVQPNLMKQIHAALYNICEFRQQSKRR